MSWREAIARKRSAQRAAEEVRHSLRHAERLPRVTNTYRGVYVLS